MAWVRPAGAPVPTVWRRFNGRRSPSAAVPPPTFVIQDIPEEMFEDAVDFMCDNFVLDEPLCRAVDMVNDPEAMAAIRGMWFKALEDRLSLVCLLQQPGAGAGGDRARGGGTPAQPPVIVGVNILVHTAKDHKDPEVRPGSLFFRVISSVLHVTHEVDVFTQYGVTEYLGAFGLSVARAYRGQNIGVEILKARVPLCKAVGLSLTATVFTAVESQVLAAKCGFVDVGEVSYQYLADTYIFPMKGITTVSMKYMALPIR